MPSELLRKWLAHYDPLRHGRTLHGVATGTWATCGWFFPRVRGGYHLRRAVGEVPSRTAPIVGAGAAGADTLREFPWVQHEPDTEYVYRLNAIGRGGVEEDSADAVAIVEFGADGEWVGLLPNSPSRLDVRAAAGGRFMLRWTYAEAGQQAAPTQFRVFTDGGTGLVDYVTPAGVVAYRPRRLFYEYVSEPWPHNAKVRWAVRAYTIADAHDTNTNEVYAWADADGPPGLEALAVEAIAESSA